MESMLTCPWRYHAKPKVKETWLSCECSVSNHVFFAGLMKYGPCYLQKCRGQLTKLLHNSKTRFLPFHLVQRGFRVAQALYWLLLSGTPTRLGCMPPQAQLQMQNQYSCASPTVFVLRFALYYSVILRNLERFHHHTSLQAWRMEQFACFLGKTNNSRTCRLCLLEKDPHPYQLHLLTENQRSSSGLIVPLSFHIKTNGLLIPPSQSRRVTSAFILFLMIF
jgi:hypothetical protein